MLKAIADRIIVQLDSEAQSKVIRLATEAKIVNKGIVLSVGPLVSRIRVGDHIVFHQFDELTLPEENKVVIREKSVLAIYEGENT